MELGKLCDVVRGSSPRPQGDPRYYGGSVPRLMVADLTRDGMYVTPKIDFLTEEGAKLSRPMKQGDVVVAVSGNPGLPAILNSDACIHDGFVGLRNLKTKVISNVFLYHFLKFNKEKTNSKAVGAIFKNLTTDQLKDIRVPLPDLKTQQKIAGILEKAYAAREKRKQAIQLTDQFLQSAFLEMFGDPVRNVMGWEVTKIGACIHKIENENPLKFPSKGYNYIDIASIDNKRKVIIDFKSIVGSNAPSRARQILKHNDIILSTVRPNLNAIAMVTQNVPNLIGSTGFCVLRANEKLIAPIFLFEICKKNFFIDHLSKIAKGASYPAVTDRQILDTEIPFPPLSMQHKFTSIVMQINQLQKKQLQCQKELEDLFKSLMKEYFGN